MTGFNIIFEDKYLQNTDSMNNRNLSSILREISGVIDSFNKADEENEHLFGHVIGLLLYLKYKGIVAFNNIKSREDISYAIIKSQHRNAAGILDLWKEIEDDYPYLEELSSLLARYDFSIYQDVEQEREFAKWCNRHYLLTAMHYVQFDALNRLMCLSTVYECQKQLGVRTDAGKLLVISDSDEIIRFVLDESVADMHITFSTQNFNTRAIRINALTLDCYSNVQLTDECFETYDGVILDNDMHREKKSWETYLDVVNPEGYLLALKQKISSLSKAFYSYEIPLMFDTVEGINMLCRKTENGSDVVRYGFYSIYGEFNYNEKNALVKQFTECIKNEITTENYQILTKTDFKVSKEIEFNKVKRLPDQVNFVWKRKEEVMTVDTDFEWLYDSEVSDAKILDNRHFSDNPFVIMAKSDFYSSRNVYKAGVERHILEDVEIKYDEQGFVSSWATTEKIYNTIERCYGLGVDEIAEEYKGFDKSLCCRVLTHPAILSFWKKVLKVDASPERPVVVRSHHFYADPDFPSSIGCTTCLDCIKIRPEYDESFIIYQLINEKDPTSKYILTAPTKEEQHTYFINKRLDYLSEFKPIVDEMEYEVQRSVAESPAYITGVGFTNFRRFAKLPSLPLAGVNVLVGGNNAGKSSFVKGLLLMFDNIKSMTTSPKFRYDANNFHDVHVGTFDRAYSNNAKEENGYTRRSMSFSMSFAHFELTITVSPEGSEDSTNVPIIAISIFDQKRNAKFVFDLEETRASAEFTRGKETVKYSDELVSGKTKQGEHMISSLLRNMVSSKKDGFILEIADELEQIINNTSLEYIYAHGVNQKVLFNYNDKNDYMAQTLHDFMVEKISKVERDFICEWLKEFDLGTDFDVHSIGGEAYIIQIKDKAGKMVYLADMGMGANQLVILILRLAILIHRHRIVNKTVYRPTVVIEEPEQNMHPGYQSKLATLFHYIHETYGFNFIVETHSEYLVRRSQVIVAHKKYQNDNDLNNNPFKVYYFPSDGMPYEMQYRKDGKFSNEFGKGFYDEATNLLFEII